MNKALYSKLLNRKLIDWIKAKRDGLHSRDINDKKTLGTEDQWTILTDNLNHPIVYSGGVGKNISFELDLIKKFDALVFAFDPSTTGIQTIENLPSMANLNFFPIALSNSDGILQLNYPTNPAEGSFTKEQLITSQQVKIDFPCRKISSLMNEFGHAKIDILKLDIEGSEYEVLDNIIDEGIKPGQICVEFHHFFESIPKKRTTDIMHRLKDTGYILFHKRELDFSFFHKRIPAGLQ